jgi:hypothetical protein
MTLITTLLEKATTEYGGYTILGLITLTVIYLLCQYFNHGLHRYPGPFLAKFTNLWRFFENYTRRSEWTHLRLHQQYGDIVRLGPNMLSFGDPAAVKSIYGLNKGFVKVELLTFFFFFFFWEGGIPLLFFLYKKKKKLLFVPWLISLSYFVFSQPFTQCRWLLQEASVFPHYSPPETRHSMPISVGQSIMRSQ